MRQWKEIQKVLLVGRGCRVYFSTIAANPFRRRSKINGVCLGALGPELIHEAWQDFNDRQTTESFDPGSPMTVVFMPWLLFNWIVESRPPGQEKFVETTLADMFLVNNLKSLTSDEQTLLRTSIRCPYTLCEVTEVKPGVGMRLLDLFRRIEFEVIEHAASQTLKRGEIIYCATSEMWGITANVGTAPFALRPTAKVDVFNLRKWMIAQSATEEITSMHLHEFELDIRGLYLNLLAGMFARRNSLILTATRWCRKSFISNSSPLIQAFHALKVLAKGWNQRNCGAR